MFSVMRQILNHEVSSMFSVMRSFNVLRDEQILNTRSFNVLSDGQIVQHEVFQC